MRTICALLVLVGMAGGARAETAEEMAQYIAEDVGKYIAIGDRCGFVNTPFATPLLGAAAMLSADGARRGLALGRTLVAGMEAQAGSAIMCRAVKPSREKAAREIETMFNTIKALAR